VPCQSPIVLGKIQFPKRNRLAVAVPRSMIRSESGKGKDWVYGAGDGNRPRPKLEKLSRTLTNVRIGGILTFCGFLKWIPIGAAGPFQMTLKRRDQLDQNSDSQSDLCVP
jgi:hypothetical protein